MIFISFLKFIGDIGMEMKRFRAYAQDGRKRFSVNRKIVSPLSNGVYKTEEMQTTVTYLYSKLNRRKLLINGR